MRLNYQNIAAALDKHLRPLYFFFGNETLLLEEALDKLRQVAAQNGYSQRERYTQETGFDWSQLQSSSQTLSLFSEKRIIELRLPTGKPGDAGAKFLIDYVQRLDANAAEFDDLFVIISADIDKRSQNTKWFKAVEEKAVVAQFGELPARELPNWIARRLTEQGVSADQQVVKRLAEYVEGNLLAAAQEINLLGLLYQGQSLNVEHLEQVMADHARFDVFQLVDTLLAGNVKRSMRILETLRREQFEPVVILWALARDMRILYRLSQMASKGQNPSRYYREFGVWQSRTGLFDAALQRLSFAQCRQLFDDIAKADLMAKGQMPFEREDIWLELEAICLDFCAAPVL